MGVLFLLFVLILPVVAQPDVLQPHVAKFPSDDIAAGDRFGHSVAYSDGTLVIGAPNDDDTGTDAGSVYVFTGSGDSWTQVAKFQSDDVVAGDRFGQAVAYRDGVLVVGADQDDDTFTDSGSVYVFTGSGASWTQVAKFQADSPGGDRLFGHSVAYQDGTIIVGESKADITAPDAGAVHVFTGSGSSWSYVTTFQPNDIMADDRFGQSVSLEDGVLAVGSPATAGAVYIFEGSGASWSQSAKFTSNDIATGDGFGTGVALGSGGMVVGAPGDDDTAADAGSVYVFNGSGASWTQADKFQSNDVSAADLFGYSVALGADILAVGAPLVDAAAADAGAMYIFELFVIPPPPPAHEDPLGTAANRTADNLGVEASSVKILYGIVIIIVLAFAALISTGWNPLAGLLGGIMGIMIVSSMNFIPEWVQGVMALGILALFAVVYLGGKNNEN